MKGQCPVCNAAVGEDGEICPKCGWDLRPDPDTSAAAAAVRARKLQEAREGWRRANERREPRSESAPALSPRLGGGSTSERVGISLPPKPIPSLTLPARKKRVESFPELCLRLIPPGRFGMGSDRGFANARPAFLASVLERFWILEAPVTQGFFLAIMEANPSRHRPIFLSSDEYPVESVSWYDAVWFCNELSEREGLEKAYKLEGVQGEPLVKGFRISCVTMLQRSIGYRLPTEVEWEYAAQLESPVATLEQQAWFGSKKTRPVKRGKPTGRGLYDLLGNVWEWVYDPYTPYPKKDGEIPVRLGEERTARGGSFAESAAYSEAASRMGADAEARADHIGFRIARSAAEGEE